MDDNLYIHRRPKLWKLLDCVSDAPNPNSQFLCPVYSSASGSHNDLVSIHTRRCLQLDKYVYEHWLTAASSSTANCSSHNGRSIPVRRALDTEFTNSCTVKSLAASVASLRLQPADFESIGRIGEGQFGVVSFR